MPASSPRVPPAAFGVVSLNLNRTTSFSPSTPTAPHPIGDTAPPPDVADRRQAEPDRPALADPWKWVAVGSVVVGLLVALLYHLSHRHDPLSALPYEDD